MKSPSRKPTDAELAILRTEIAALKAAPKPAAARKTAAKPASDGAN